MARPWVSRRYPQTFEAAIVAMWPDDFELVLPVGDPLNSLGVLTTFPRRLGRCIRTRSIAMTYRIWYRVHLTGAMMVAALMVNVPTATAQLTEQQSRFV